jgi:1-acyl-sn-glycerol-3-phosphate acyltransferase
MFTRRLLNFLLKIAFKLLLNLEVGGLENVPLEGPLVLMINHTSLLDPAMAGGVMPREVVAMSKIENFRDPILGIIVRLYGAFPVQRGEVDLQATRRALEVLHNGEVLLMAPEGTRSEECRLQPGHDGMTFIARRANAPVLPMAITGVKDFSSNLKRLRRTSVKVVIGKPFRFQLSEEKIGRDVLQQMTEEAMYQLAAILPPEYRGVYGDLDSATERFLVFEDEDKGHVIRDKG